MRLGLRLLFALAATAWLGALASTACLELPPHFRAVSLERANALIADPNVGLVEVIEEGIPAARLARGLRWRLGVGGGARPRVAEAAVLVVAATRPAARASAAALVREGHRPVYLFVPDNDAERGALVAAALAAKEEAGGEDS